MSGRGVDETCGLLSNIFVFGTILETSIAPKMKTIVIVLFSNTKQTTDSIVELKCFGVE